MRQQITRRDAQRREAQRRNAWRRGVRALFLCAVLLTCVYFGAYLTGAADALAAALREHSDGPDTAAESGAYGGEDGFAALALSGRQEGTPQEPLTAEDAYELSDDVADSALPWPGLPSLGDTGSSGGVLPSDSAPGIPIKNDAGLETDTEALLAAALSFALGDTGPQVLIIHTHGSEAYTPDPQNNYIPDDTDRTVDTRYNVVRVGRELAGMLNDAGIACLQSVELHDYPSYNGSYNRSLETVQAILKQNPSIKVVIDLHRDAVIREDGTRFRTETKIDGKTAAQLMLVVGTDAGGLKHPNWLKNLNFALKLHRAMETTHPGLMRPLNLRAQRFNQHTSPGSLLIEVGSSGNTLDEALIAVRAFGEAMIELLGK